MIVAPPPHIARVLTSRPHTNIDLESIVVKRIIEYPFKRKFKKMKIKNKI